MREVTNEEFNTAWADENNIKLMNSVIKKYCGSLKGLSTEEFKSMKMMALWKCLGKHDYTRQKFTSSLYRFITWECLRSINEKVKNSMNYKQIDKLTNSLSYLDSDEFSLLDALNNEECGLFNKFYSEKQTLSEIAAEEGLSREWIRQKILKIKAKIANDV